jgi:hypothetical protein
METTCVFAAGEFFCGRCLSILALDKYYLQGRVTRGLSVGGAWRRTYLYLLLTFRVIEHSTALCHFYRQLVAQAPDTRRTGHTETRE